MNQEKISEKILVNHEVPDYSFRIWYLIGLEEVFYKVILDGRPTYLFNEYPILWYTDPLLRSIYQSHNLHINLNTRFMKDSLPDRCLSFYNSLCNDFQSYLKGKRGRVSMVKLKATVKLLMKNVSRLKYHKKYAILYSKREANWVGAGNHYSHNYFMELIDYLAGLEMVKDFTGFATAGSSANIMSMLLVTPDFIESCNGLSENLLMDEEFRAEVKCPVEIRVRVGKTSHKVIKVSKEEKELNIHVNSVMDQLNTLLRTSYIEIGNVSIPEYFLTRIFRDDMTKCGRVYDQGEIQGENADTRATIRIDNEDTIEIDYSSLHYSLAAEELGLDLKDKDPYDFPFDIDIDLKEVSKWKNSYNIKLDYDPVRNLKKVALLTMFNAESEEDAVRGISDAIRKDFNRIDKSTRRFVGLRNIPVKKLVKSVIAHNQDVSSYFNSGSGIRLQNLDSNMIAYCIERFIEVNQVLLPVHDSIIIKKSLLDYGVKCMYDAYESVMGSKVNCRLKF